MADRPLDRRRFLSQTAAGAGMFAAGLAAGCDDRDLKPEKPAPPPPIDDPAPAVRPEYHGPNVIVVRFGGGVRRRETVRHDVQTYCPFVYHELAGKHGVLFNNLVIDSQAGVETSHGQGTLYLLTGRYDHYVDVYRQPLADRFEAPVPTMFEYLRRAYDVPEHQALIVNGEDRINEEFYTFSNHHLYGVHYRSTVLSLYRFKSYLLRQDLQDPNLPEPERHAKEKQLAEMERKDYRVRDNKVVSPQLDSFWGHWRDYYGKSGFVNPRGDRLLTELSLRALKELRPRLMLINYQDPDYVHWGPPSFYTRAIGVIDDGIRQLWQAVQADEEYRGNTVFLIVPDCGRDDNRFMAVPYQHHFNTRSAHEIFLAAAGPGIAHPHTPVDKLRQQIGVAATVGRLMKFPTRHTAEGPLTEVFA
jgi:hypothetical protein